LLEQHYEEEMAFKAREGGTLEGEDLGYRGGEIALAETPLFLGILKNYTLDPNDQFEKGVLQLLKGQNMRTSETKDDAGKVLAVHARYPQMQVISLDQILDMPRGEQPHFKKLGMTSALTSTDGKGIIPFGRANVNNYLAFYEFREKFDATYKSLFDALESDETERKAFLAAAEKAGAALTYDALRNGALLNNPSLLGWVYTTYLQNRLHNINPTIDAIKRLEEKFVDLDATADYRVSRHIEGKAEFYLLVLRRNGKKTLYLTAPTSTKGPEVCLPGKRIEDLRPRLEEETQYDHGDPLRGEVGTGKLDDFAFNSTRYTPTESVLFDLRRRIKDKEGRILPGSPLTHVPIMDLSDPAKQAAYICIGHADPRSADPKKPTEIQRENIIIVTNYK
jgi:hypothetical protein